MPDLPLHPVHDDINHKPFDVFIAGSGPIGATYARLLVDRGFSVCIVEIGDLHDSLHPAAHQKNEVRYQKDIDKFVRVIQGALSTVSIPISSTVIPTLDPDAWRPSIGDSATISHGRNPKQALHNNLGAEAVTRCVGGMATHWTCATPEFLKGLERPQIFPNDEQADDREWANLYQAARALIGTSDKEFDHSIRHNVVLNALKNDPLYAHRGVKALPLACHILGKGPYVRWHSAENIYGRDFFSKEPPKNSGRGIIRLLANTRCTKLVTDERGQTIRAVEVQDLLSVAKGDENVDYNILAKVFVVAAGAIGTPQILANSGFGGLRSQVENNDKVLCPTLGQRITEQPMAFCQVVLKQGLVEDVTSHKHPEWWRKAVEEHRKKFPKDPIAIPIQDPAPQVTIPASEKFPWHTQIHRDAFSYGEAGPLVDQRLVVDLRFFGMQDGVDTNRILFEDEILDAYGMPQPTFEYTPTRERATEASRMMNDMTNAANILGGYLPGSNPQFMTPGLALHLGGSIRLGHENEKAESVADYNSLVWDTSNLYVAGNGTIPTKFAANPTLTSMALAIRSAYKIYQCLSQSQGSDASSSTKVKQTPSEWLTWLLDPNDQNYPDHKELRQLESVITVC